MVYNYNKLKIILFFLLTIKILNPQDLMALSFETEDITSSQSLIVMPNTVNTLKNEITNHYSAPKKNSLIDTIQSQDPFLPLVQVKPGNQLEISPFLSENFVTLLSMNDLSYALAKNQTEKTLFYHQFLTEEKWQIIPFLGKTGKDLATDDVPGFVAYNSEKNLIQIIFHGSSSSADWSTNFDFKKADVSDLQIKGRGKIHRGFANKYVAARNQLEENLDYFINTMTPNQKESLRIIVSGHSQGGSLASIATADLAANYAKRVFGADFNNAISNKIYGYFLSPPRVYGDEDSFEWANSVVGKHNMLRHNVKHDPVPNVVPGKTIASVLSYIPFMGETLADNYAGYKSIGYLAMDDTSAAIQRGILLQNSILDDPETSLFQKAHVYLAPLHGGSIREDKTNAIFDPLIINKDLDKILNRGQEYKNKSKEIQNGSYNYLQLLKHKFSG